MKFNQINELKEPLNMSYVQQTNMVHEAQDRIYSGDRRNTDPATDQSVLLPNLPTH